MPKDGIAKARMLLSEDEWALIDAARRATDDDEFAAIFTKLNQLWTAHGEAETTKRMTGLVQALGMKPAMALGKLIKEVQAH